MATDTVGSIPTMMASNEFPPGQQTAALMSSSFPYKSTYTGNVGNDMGISTIGYSSNQRIVPEWEENNYSKYYKAYAGRDNAERVRLDANNVIKETEVLTNATQAESTKKLAERLKDVNFWKAELEREINDVIIETDLVCEQKKRPENAPRSTEVPLHIASDNLNCRQMRQGVDLVQDEVDLNLLKEVEVSNNAQDLLKRTIKEADMQITRNRDRKKELEMDWSDKKEADEMDSFCAGLRNEHTCKQFFAGSAKFQEIQSTPES
ncbi:hypothetical protein CAPTEDRAFT_213472 [Capitella teleta]|uniref:Tektin n=1 Tax=Capitella teleta TaxID=283909 RepID=R7TJL6_CAPTE|nr:hypothetical protein CAPTEDRAFT_213472 [Capitella teleta]|eukprot:ELT93692.1 hypothetical protein CAPTEDRAFT_213472 [Capitella teleta]